MTAIKICYFVTHDKYMQFVNLFCDTWQIQGESPPSQSPFAAQVGSPQKASNFVDAVVQVGPPSLKPSQDACKLQMLRTELAQKDMQKDMDIMGLSPLAVIMITVFRKVFPHEIWNILNMLEEKNISDSLVFGVFGSLARTATSDNTAGPGRSHLSAQQVWIWAQKNFAGAEGGEGTFCWIG